MKSCRTPQPIFLCILPENRSMTCSQLGDFLYSMEGPSRRPFLPLVAAVVQLLSYVWLFATPWTTAFQVSLSSLPPGVCSDSCPLSQGCYLTISSSAAPFSFCLQSFPTSGSFPMSRFFASGGQSIVASASASVLLMNIQGLFPLGLTDLISLQSKGRKSLLQHHSSKASVLQCSAFFMVQLSHLYMTTGKTTALTIWTFVSKVMSLFFNTLSWFVICLSNVSSIWQDINTGIWLWLIISKTDVNVEETRRLLDNHTKFLFLCLPKECRLHRKKKVNPRTGLSSL